MARTIADLKLILSVITGYDAGDPVSADAPTQAALGRGTPQAGRSLRVAFYEDDGYSAPTTETRAAVRTAAKVLQESGFAVEPFRPAGLDRARELWATIFVDCTWTVMSPSFADTRHQMSADLREYLEIASARPALTGERLLSELLERDSLRGDFLKQMERFPILLAPVCAIPAFRHEDAGWGPQHAADYFRTMTYSQHYNLLGLPAAVVPVGRSPEGLPIGVQVIGRPWREDEVLDIAEVIEKEFGYRTVSLQSSVLSHQS
jgi:Asp-tRNA(Asn)/Glu-tRNA(Gln) amidotransferase A subunit family amidase